MTIKLYSDEIGDRLETRVDHLLLELAKVTAALKVVRPASARLALKMPPIQPVAIPIAIVQAEREVADRRVRDRVLDTGLRSRGAAVAGTGRNRVLVGVSREVRQLVKPWLDTGWTAEKMPGGHIKLVKAEHSITIPATPSDSRALKNVRAEFRRAERAIAKELVAA